MINSHKELVKSVLNWADKMDFINSVVYLTDINKMENTINNADPRGFIFGPIDFSHDDEYNDSVTYGFSIIDKTTNDIDAIITSEQENMFCVSALSDYINFIDDGDVDFDAMSIDNYEEQSGTLTSCSGQFTLNIKRTASYWKKMEEYSE